MDHNSLTIVLRHITILICSNICIFKFLNLKKPTKMQIILYTFYFTVMSAITLLLYLTSPYSAGITTFLVYATSISFSKFILKLNFKLSFIINIISYVYSTFAFFIATFILAFILDLVNAPKELFTIVMIIVSTATFFIIFIPFKFKRYRKGMPFLKDNATATMGLIITIPILVCLFITYFIESELVAMIVFSLFSFFSIVFLLWWKVQIKRSYLKKLQAMEYENMQLTIEKQQKEIEKLIDNNDQLAKIIHKDNKLIPAMAFSVKSFLESYDNNPAEIKPTANALLKQLEDITAERQGILENYQYSSKIIPKTNINGVDSIIVYMNQKSIKNNIDFNLTLNGDIKNVTDNVIEENQLTTLVSDLIENAFIAIRPCKSRHILVNLGLNKDGYYIEVADSGIPFEIDTLVHLGTMKITTHKHEGGSGIGLSNAFDLFRQHNASFMVEEFATSDSGYTKKITVAFNNKCEYIVKTPRAKEIINSPFKNDIIVKSA